MAGRSKKSMFDDIKEIETPKEPQIYHEVKATEKVVEAEPVVEEKPADIPTYRSGVVKANPWLNVRNAPFGDIVGTLDDGVKVTIYEEKKGFGKISENEDKWVKLEFVVF